MGNWSDSHARGLSQRVVKLLLGALLAMALVPVAPIEAHGEEADELSSYGEGEAAAEEASASEAAEAVEKEEGTIGDAPLDEAAQTEALDDEAGESEALALSASQNPQIRSEQQIRSFLQSHRHDAEAKVSYAAKPNASAPYAAGALSSATLNDALNALNFVRYVAGIDADVTLDEEYNRQEQAAALVLAANSTGLSHTPSKPSGMSDALYGLGYTGASSGNLGFGYSNPADSILAGYMSDADSSNIDRVGHRRWCLNPQMGKTGFGYAGGYTGMKAFDSSRISSYTNISWPARTMPAALFSSDDPWSLQCNASDFGDVSSISVKLTRARDGRTWNFSQAHSDGEFYIDKGGYGSLNAIIFRPSDIDGYRAGDSFSVEVSGARGSYPYAVRFFDLFEGDRIELLKSTGGEKYVGLGKTVVMKLAYPGAFEAMDAYGFPQATSALSYPGFVYYANKELNARRMTWSSSDPSVATVESSLSGGWYLFINGAIVPTDREVSVFAKKPGTATVTCMMPNGLKNSFTVKVDRYDLASATPKTWIDSQVYRGKPLCPKAPIEYWTGSLGYKELVEGTDYKVSWENNDKPGQAYVVYTGIGQYQGTYRLGFTIEKGSSPAPSPAPDPSPTPGGDTPAGKPAKSTLARLAGPNALGTMAAVTSASFKTGSCDSVVVATIDGYWDALTASGLAGLKKCPILITDGGSLSSETAAEIKRLKAATVYIAGGPAAVSDNVKAQVSKLPDVKTVSRLAGDTAIGTALKIYQEGKKSNAWGTTAVVATSATYHDALSASPYAYAKAAPVFLANASTKTLDANVLAAIKSGGFKRVVITGGTAAISASLDKRLAGLGMEVVRKGGATAYETSSEIASWCISQGMTARNVGIATGESYYDALTGAALCGKSNSALVLVSDGNRSAIGSFIRPNRSSIVKAYVFGGPAAVSAATYAEIVSSLG